MRLTIGAVAGWCFHGQADLEVAHHCQRGTEKGFYCTRKRLVDRAAFNYDPRLGWETDRWFTWEERENGLD